MSGPLRVSLDATPLLGPTTGVGEFCRGALSGLSERDDVEVSAFAVSWRRRYQMLPLLPAGVRAVRRPMPARPLHAAWSRFEAPAVEWWTGPCEVVHGTNYVVPPSKRAARVVSVHDLTTTRFPELCSEETLRFPALVRRAVERGAWVHTPSQFVANEVVEILKVPAERVRAIHHGVPTSKAMAAERPSSVVLPDAAQRYLLFLGTVEPRKDLPTLARAFGKAAADHPDLWLVVAGGEGWGAKEFSRAVTELSPEARDRVVRTGYVDSRTRVALLKAAVAFVYPSLYEGFGLPPLEAMTEGVPVVATRAGAVPETVGEAALLVEPGDSDALADAIDRVLTDETLRNHLTDTGRERITQFSWERCAEGLANLYRDAWETRAGLR